MGNPSFTLLIPSLIPSKIYKYLITKLLSLLAKEMFKYLLPFTLSIKPFKYLKLK